MKIKELELVIENKDKLDKEDIEVLNSYNLFDQYKDGELDLSVIDLLQLLSLLEYLCEKHRLK
jgi:hypothetical protein